YGGRHGLLAGRRRGEVEAAPVRQFAKTSGTGQRDVMGDVDLDAWSDLNAAPDRTIGGSRASRSDSTLRAAIERRADFVKRARGGLPPPDLQQPVEMSLGVVMTAPDSERRRDQPFLYVVPDRSTRDVGQICQVLNRVARLVGGGHRLLI